MLKKKIISAGLGGGLDIVNASLIYFAALREGFQCQLGSIRPAPLIKISNDEKFSQCGSFLQEQSTIQYGLDNFGKLRYCQPKIASYLKEKVLYFSRKYDLKNNPSKLRQAIQKARGITEANEIFFVDGGGDSLTFLKEDAAGTSENGSNPFAGGDSITLEALSGANNCYLAVISAGLDISESAFQKNVQILKERKAYYGRINLRTGEKDQYKLQEILSFNTCFLQDYFKLTEEIVGLNNEQEKPKSHTAVITYNALRGNFKACKTFVPWQPKEGVMVKDEHCWMYFFDGGKIHSIKKQMNKI